MNSAYSPSKQTGSPMTVHDRSQDCAPTEVSLSASSLKQALVLAAAGAHALTKVSVRSAGHEGELWIEQDKIVYAFYEPGSCEGAIAFAAMACMTNPTFTLSLPEILPANCGRRLDLSIAWLSDDNPKQGHAADYSRRKVNTRLHALGANLLSAERIRIQKAFLQAERQRSRQCQPERTAQSEIAGEHSSIASRSPVVGRIGIDPRRRLVSTILLSIAVCLSGYYLYFQVSPLIGTGACPREINRHS